MDLLFTLLLIYLAYRGYRWYSRLQQQVSAGKDDPFRVDQNRKSRSDWDEEYIDYEEID
ncbi:MAG: hypothetical protein AAFQ37_09455 [Bacteroidota bacterium]